MEEAKTFLNPDYSEITAFKTFCTVGNVEGEIQQWIHLICISEVGKGEVLQII